MGFTDRGAGIYRVFALPAARLAVLNAAGAAGLALFAGAVRILPLVLGASGLPLRAAYPLARAALAVSLETALFVAPPLAWALASAALVERGEARALFALGARPRSVVASAWPSLLLLAAAAAIASSAWAADAVAPGRLARALVADVRSACAAAVAAPEGGPQSRPVAFDIPSVGLSWVCFPGEEPRIVGPAPFGAAVLSAGGVDLSDDLRAIHVNDLTIAFSPSNSGALAAAHIHVGRASIQGLAPLARASNLSVAQRTAFMAGSSAILASLAAWVTLSLSIKSRALAGAIGLLGPASALMLFSTLERRPTAPLTYLAAPAVGVLSIAAAFAAGILLARRRPPA